MRKDINLIESTESPYAEISIKEIEIKYFKDEALNEQQRLALNQFYNYQKQQLEKVENNSFFEVFEKIRMLSSLVDYRDFLKNYSNLSI